MSKAHGPRTFGELRRQLHKMGDPWQVDPARADEEPLPEYPTGGQLDGDPPGALLAEGALDEHLKRGVPPANPQLRDVWREQGLLRD
jgi:hypothetical protein